LDSSGLAINLWLRSKFSGFGLSYGLLALLLTIKTSWAILVDVSSEITMKPRSEVLQGTLDLMVLKTLDALGPIHGYGIAQRIQQISQDVLYLNQGTLYPALLRLEQRGWIHSEWGISDNNRRAKYYSLTKAGRKQLRDETEDWQRMSAIINRLLETAR
jgi:PadR family transcriptional regulator, regulatory protein PadR